jgi:hypothetical protein
MASLVVKNKFMSTKKVEPIRPDATPTGRKSLKRKAVPRVNAFSQGLRARSIILPGDDAQEFEQLCADLQAFHQPRNRPEQLLVEKMAIAEWELARLQRMQTALLIQSSSDQASQVPLFDRISQHISRLERSSLRVFKELQHLIAKSPRQEEAPTTTHVSLAYKDSEGNEEVVVPPTPIKPH